MKRFIRHIAGSRGARCTTESVCLAAPPLSVALLLAVAAAAQPPVQFPTASPAANPFNPYAVPGSSPPPTFAPPASSPAYPTTPYAPSPYAVPAAPAPYNPQAVGPPPTFDPYASGSTLGPPPPAAPYAYTPTPPPPASAYPQQPASLYPNGLPYQFQPGAIATTTPGEGYWVKAQRLLQELSFEYTYLWGDHISPGDFEINRAELSSTFAVPMFYNIETPLLVTPGFAVNWLEGPIGDPAGMPRGPDLPPRLYDAYLDFAWYPRVNEWLGGELGVRTGVWSDFDEVSTDSIRLLGRGLARVSLTPQLDILFGAVYLDRLRVKILPAGGVYWRPTPDWDAYIVFPNPKVRRFMTAVGNSKWYWYVAGEYGGGSWTVERPAAGANPEIDDRIDYNDIRVIGGLEWETQSFIRGHVEAGYVWDREILFQSGMPGEFNPDDTFMVRGGIDF